MSNEVSNVLLFMIDDDTHQKGDEDDDKKKEKESLDEARRKERAQGLAERESRRKAKAERRAEKKRLEEEAKRLQEEREDKAWVPSPKELDCGYSSSEDADENYILEEEETKRRMRERQKRNEMREAERKMEEEAKAYEKKLKEHEKKEAERVKAEKEKLAAEKARETWQCAEKRHEERLKGDRKYRARFQPHVQNMEASTDTTETVRPTEPAHPGIWKSDVKKGGPLSVSRGTVAPSAMKGIGVELEKGATLFTNEAQVCFGDISFSVRDEGVAGKALLSLISGEATSSEKVSALQPLDLSDRFLSNVLSLFSDPEFLDQLARIKRDPSTFQSNTLQLCTSMSKKTQTYETPDEMSARLYGDFTRSLNHCMNETNLAVYGGNPSAFTFNARAVLMLLYQSASWGDKYWNTYGMKNEGAPTVKSGRYRATSSRMGMWAPRAPTNQPRTILSKSSPIPFEKREERPSIWALPEDVKNPVLYPSCATNYPNRTRCIVEMPRGLAPSRTTYYFEDEERDIWEVRPQEKTTSRVGFMHEMWRAFRQESRRSALSQFEHGEENFYMQTSPTMMDTHLLWTMRALGMCSLDGVVRKLIDILLQGAATKKGCRIGGPAQKRDEPCERLQFYKQEIESLCSRQVDDVNAYITRFWSNNRKDLEDNEIRMTDGHSKLYRNAVAFSAYNKKTQNSAVFFRNTLEHRIYAFFVICQGDPDKQGQVDFGAFSDACNELLGYVFSTNINEELAEYRCRSTPRLIPSINTAILAMGHVLFPGGLPSPLDYYAPISGYITRTKECFEERYKGSIEVVTLDGESLKASKDPVKFRGEINVGVTYTHSFLSTETLLASNRRFSDICRLHMHLMGGGQGEKPTWGIASHRHTLPAKTTIGTLFGETHWTLRPVSGNSKYHTTRQLYPVAEYVWACYVGQVSETYECWMYIDGRFFSNYPRYVRYTDNKAHANARFVRKNLSNYHAQANPNLPHVPQKASRCPFWKLKTTKEVPPHTELLVYNPIAGSNGPYYFYRQALSGSNGTFSRRPEAHFVRLCRSIGETDPETFNHHIRLYGQQLEMDYDQNSLSIDAAFMDEWMSVTRDVSVEGSSSVQQEASFSDSQKNPTKQVDDHKMENFSVQKTLIYSRKRSAHDELIYPRKRNASVALDYSKNISVHEAMRRSEGLLIK